MLIIDIACTKRDFISGQNDDWLHVSDTNSGFDPWSFEISVLLPHSDSNGVQRDNVQTLKSQ